MSTLYSLKLPRIGFCWSNMSEPDFVETTNHSNINVITAIGSPEREALISRSLYNSGKDIRHRALSFSDLTHFIEESDLSTQRWLIVISPDLLGFEESVLRQWQSENLSYVLLDSTNNVLTADEILAMVSSHLRSPMVHRAPRARKLISAVAITGTYGSPGRSMIATNLAMELSESKQIVLVEADTTNPSLSLSLGLPDRSWQTETKKKIAPNFSIQAESNFLPDQIERDQLYIVDAGAIGDIQQLRTDRRRNGALQAAWLESCATLIYVAKADDISLHQLEYFVAQRRHLPARQELLFVMNCVGNSRRYRELEKNFRQLAPGAKFLIPSDHATMERVTAHQTTLREIAPRSRIRKSLLEIVRHLAS